MHLRSKTAILCIALLILFIGTFAAQTQTSPPPQQGSSSGSYDIATPDDPAPGAAPATRTPATAPTAPPQPAPEANPANQPNTAPGTANGASAAPPNQPSDTVRVPQAQAPESQNNGVYVFRKNVQEVQLHASVVDDRNRLVTSLDQNAFTVYENGQPQQITLFARRDVPVALGIVIDNSGSMREKRQAVNDAALNLVKSSNPQDKVFVVNYNDEYWLDVDFTSDVDKLKEGLERIESRGGTALYDAVVASAEHLKSAPLEKKVLLVITDGEDNASRESLEQAIRRVQTEDGPTVYTIGILGNDSHQRRARRALQELAEQTGGVSFFPKDLAEVDAISQSVARDIRNQYVIGYKSTIPKTQGEYRTVKVEARARGFGKLQVRTKAGYYAGQERAAR